MDEDISPAAFLEAVNTVLDVLEETKPATKSLKFIDYCADTFLVLIALRSSRCTFDDPVFLRAIKVARTAIEEAGGIEATLLTHPRLGFRIKIKSDSEDMVDVGLDHTTFPGITRNTWQAVTYEPWEFSVSPGNAVTPLRHSTKLH